MTRPAQRRAPGEPRYLWPAASVLPLHKAEPPLDLSWHGTLTSNPGGHVGGELRNARGWVLDLVGNASGGVLHLRARVAVCGVLMAEFEDGGVSGELEQRADAGSWPLVLVRDGDGWRGVLAGNGWSVTVTGKALQPGSLSLNGSVEDAL